MLLGEEAVSSITFATVVMACPIFMLENIGFEVFLGPMLA
jgi:hypothetical protein